jgi:hypothetical protein
MITTSLIIGTNENDYESEKFNYVSNNVFELLDKSKKPLFWAQLNYDNNNFYIETDYLTVLDFNPEMKYIKVELDEKTLNLFNKIDDKAVELLDNLISNEEFSDLFDEIEGQLDYSTLAKINNTSNKYFLKIKLDDKIKISFNKKKSNINELYEHSFSPEDKLRLLLEINSLNLYKNDYKCGLKYYCHNIELNTPINTSQFKRPVHNNDNYKFTPSKINQPVAEELECDLGATEVSPKDESKFSTLTINTEQNEENYQQNENNEETTNIQTTTENIFISTSNKKTKPRVPPKSKIITETITKTTTNLPPKKKTLVKNK